jgi:hypothetical protein
MSSESRSVSASANPSTPSKIDHRMKLYSAAAIAAGVGALALAPHVEAEVVITRKTIPIPVNSYFFPPPKPVLISLNNDGVNDFSFSLYSFAYHSTRQSLDVRPLEGGAVVGKTPEPGAQSSASVLFRGAKIGPSAHFSSKGDCNIEAENKWVNSSNSTTGFNTIGNWGKNPSNTYLGVKFLIDGETHYGWVRLTVGSGPSGLSGTITAYAYETEPNKQILAGIPENKNDVKIINLNGPSLGALAAGADGLSKWRH